MTQTSCLALKECSNGCFRVLSAEEINSDPRLTFVRRGGHDFSFIWKDTKCKDEPGLAYLVEMWARKEGPVDAYIGRSCARTNQHVHNFKTLLWWEPGGCCLKYKQKNAKF